MTSRAYTTQHNLLYFLALAIRNGWITRQEAWEIWETRQGRRIFQGEQKKVGHAAK